MSRGSPPLPILRNTQLFVAKKFVIYFYPVQLPESLKPLRNISGSETPRLSNKLKMQFFRDLTSRAMYTVNLAYPINDRIYLNKRRSCI